MVGNEDCSYDYMNDHDIGQPYSFVIMLYPDPVNVKSVGKIIGPITQLLNVNYEASNEQGRW